MRIAIIGAGNVDGGLGRAAARAGHDVVLSISPNAATGWVWQSAFQLVGPTA